MSMEEWRAAPGYEHYEVSNLGRVRSLDRSVEQIGPNGGLQVNRYRGRIRKTSVGNSGYEQVGMSNDGLTKPVMVHRLIALAFCKRKKGADFVNHIDHNKQNNAATNLEWVTHSENCLHCMAAGRNSRNIRKLTPEREAELRAAIAAGMKFRDAAKEFGVSKSLVHLYAHGH